MSGVTIVLHGSYEILQDLDVVELKIEVVKTKALELAVFYKYNTAFINISAPIYDYHTLVDKAMFIDVLIDALVVLHGVLFTYAGTMTLLYGIIKAVATGGVYAHFALAQAIFFNDELQVVFRRKAGCKRGHALLF